MITIFFQRKSAGKSTLLAQLASEQATRKQRVAIMDTDPQQTISNWGVYRREHERLPRIDLVAVRKGADLKRAVEAAKGRYDHIFIDLQGGDTPEDRAALLLADKIILPFKASQPDLDNIEYIDKMLKTLREHRPKTEIHFVINEAPYTKEVSVAKTYFEARGLEVTETVVYSRKAYRESMGEGRGVCEMRDEKAKVEIQCLWAEIYKKGRLADGAGKSERVKRKA